MQLKQGVRGRRASLAAATLGLLGAAPSPASADTSADAVPGGATWNFDSALLVYQEGGGRVQAIEPVVSGAHDLGDDRQLSVKFVFDTLSGATPNGATPASTPQTFSGPSGSTGYTTPANQTPLDKTFHDQRYALSLDYLAPLTDSVKAAVGGNFSIESDFSSAGASLRLTQDMNRKNTTLAAGLNYEQDTVSPIGGAPQPLAVMPPPSVTPPDGGGEGDGEGGGHPGKSKAVVDGMLGLTQLVSASALLQFNYSLSVAKGYQNDPYKILSVVGPDGEPLRYVYESRPESRIKHALFGRYKQFVFDRDVLDASYRFMSDDWGIRSQTADLGYRWNFGQRHFLEPHLRWYTQTPANFYRAALYDGEETTLQYASADPRLGAFHAWTAGLKFGGQFAGGSEWSARLEYYVQKGTVAGVPAQAAAGLSKFNLDPDLTAAMLTVGYRFRW